MSGRTDLPRDLPRRNQIRTAQRAAASSEGARNGRAGTRGEPLGWPGGGIKSATLAHSRDVRGRTGPAALARQKSAPGKAAGAAPRVLECWACPRSLAGGSESWAISPAEPRAPMPIAPSRLPQLRSPPDAPLPNQGHTGLLQDRTGGLGGHLVGGDGPLAREPLLACKQIAR